MADDSSLVSAGSSPRARGTPIWWGRELHGPRFIPACAGNTAPSRTRTRSPSVHPRVRGEHVERRVGPQHGDGSSPRARGTPPHERQHRAGGRFIPACAGNTATSRSTVPGRSVHPRVRGEHVSANVFAHASCGSSPRARGTRRRDAHHRRGRRFIPACAGNTLVRRRMPCRQTVHPRVRGEHFYWNPVTNTRAGSSPRARGTLPARARRGARGRFIPACAGNTAPPRR